MGNNAAAENAVKGRNMADTNLAQAVEAADELSAYDMNIKFLLADKQILAWILKYAVCEFRDMEIDDIMGSIGEDIKVGTKPLDAGLSNMGRVHASATEDGVPGEGVIFFDIRFTAYHKEEEMKFLINIEAQKSSDPSKLGYHLENRIIFYLARMVSAQKQTEFYHSDYDSLKKVRSIWICMDNSMDGDSIEEIGLAGKTVFGSRRNLYNADLLKGIIINVRSGKNINESRNMLISMLEKLLSQKSAEEKKRILAEEYGMVMTTELEGRIRTMCNLSENIKAIGIKEGIEQGIEKGIEQGIERGIEQGIERGIQRERLNAVRRMVEAGAEKKQILSFGYTEDEFAEAERI